MKILIVVDPQKDFCLEGGPLYVKGAETVVPRINELLESDEFDAKWVTQDWHPKDHCSFAETHGADLFSVKETPYGSQVMWPVHCVAGTFGAEVIKELRMDCAELILRKGTNPLVESYSAFDLNDGRHTTHRLGLDGIMRRINERGEPLIVTIAGFATDYCCLQTAISVKRIMDDDRESSQPNEVRAVWSAMKAVAQGDDGAIRAQYKKAGIFVVE